MLGILLIDKPRGCTSHDVVDGVRRRLHTRRVGHAGTLDPLATGVLVVAVGPATRFLQYLPLEPKVYEGEIAFGRETSTMDAEGEVVAEKPVPKDLEALVRNAAPSFIGLIQQMPPMHSAIKKDGKPLYAYARQGQTVERRPRTVRVDSFEIEQVEDTVARIRVVCSGGTYVRSLAHDLGQAVGCGAHLSALRRTHVGRFAIDGAIPPGSVAAEHLLPLREALEPMAFLSLDDEKTQRIREGRQLDVGSEEPDGLVALLDPEGKVFGIARRFDARLQPECVIPLEANDGSV